jgi:Protein of unknown function (DUF4038)
VKPKALLDTENWNRVSLYDGSWEDRREGGFCVDNHDIEEVNEKRERDELLFTASDPKIRGILLPHGMKVKWALGGLLMESYRSILACLLPGALFIGLVSGQSLNRARASYPLKISLTGRYLVDQDNHPFLMSGDSADALLAQLLPVEADMYFANREANDFNVIWFQVLTDKGYGGRANGSTPDGIVPFTTSWDFSTPNEAYFARLDDYVNRARTHGLTTFLDPIETGGLIKILRTNGATKAFNYGVYLGNRYRNFKNIVWLTGNDYKIDPDDDLLLTAVIRGIKSVDPRHLHTSENNSVASGPGQTSLDDPNIGRLRLDRHLPTDVPGLSPIDHSGLPERRQFRRSHLGWGAWNPSGSTTAGILGHAIWWCRTALR